VPVHIEIGGLETLPLFISEKKFKNLKIIQNTAAVHKDFIALKPTIIEI